MKTLHYDVPLKAEMRSVPMGLRNLIPWSEGQAIPSRVKLITLFISTTVPSGSVLETHSSWNVSERTRRIGNFWIIVDEFRKGLEMSRS